MRLVVTRFRSLSVCSFARVSSFVRSFVHTCVCVCVLECEYYGDRKRSGVNLENRIRTQDTWRDARLAARSIVPCKKV